MKDILKGWRTILVGLIIAIGPSALNYLGGVDWTKLVSPDVSLFIAGTITVLMRLITTTPVRKST